MDGDGHATGHECGDSGVDGRDLVVGGSIDECGAGVHAGVVEHHVVGVVESVVGDDLPRDREWQRVGDPVSGCEHGNLVAYGDHHVHDHVG